LWGIGAFDGRQGFGEFVSFLRRIEKENTLVEVSIYKNNLEHSSIWLFDDSDLSLLRKTVGEREWQE
jgi:hypothetical protein